MKTLKIVPRICVELLLLLFWGLLIPAVLSWIFIFLLALIRDEVR